MKTAMTSRGWRRFSSIASANQVDELGHQPGRIERRRGLEDDADLLAVLVEGDDVVGAGLVAAAVPLVLLAVDEQVAVQLLDVVFGDRDVFPRPEHKLHRLGIAGDLLLVAGGEGFDLEVGEQPFDLAVGELAALDPGGGADALDRGDAPQRRQPFGRERSQRPPGALEFIDLGNQRQDLRGDPEGVGSDGHTRIDTQSHPNSKPPECPPNSTRLGRT